MLKSICIFAKSKSRTPLMDVGLSIDVRARPPLIIVGFVFTTIRVSFPRGVRHLRYGSKRRVLLNSPFLLYSGQIRC